MSGRHKTYKVELTETESKQLRQVVAARKSSQSEAKRAKVILQSAEHPEWTDAQVASSIGCSPAMGAEVAETLVSKPQFERGSS